MMAEAIKQVWRECIEGDMSHVAKVIVAVLFVGLWTVSRLTRWRLYDDTHRRFDGKYALSKADEAKGLKRMNKSGYRGIRDAQYIVRQVTSKDMPFIYTKALEYALFRTYGVPSISKILYKTGNFVKADKSSRRYIDTTLLIVAFLFYPLPRLELEDNDSGHDRPDEDILYENGGDDDPRAAIALARVNFLHRRADSIHGPAGAGISNEDLLYTLSVFVSQPIVWTDAFAWRKLSALEKEAIFTVMYHVGRCMKIQGIPDTLDSFLDWAEEFEQRRLVFEPTNNTVASETVELLLWALPRPLRPALYPVIASIMDDRLRRAVGFEKPPKYLSLFPKSLLNAAAFIVRHFGLPRQKYSVVVPYHGDGTILIDGSPTVIGSKKFSSATACPFGGSDAKQKPDATSTSTSSRPRMVPKWYENDPHYSTPAPLLSARWMYERLFVPLDQRYGARKWQRLATRSGDGAMATSNASTCPAGYRLEECGPRGTEDLGHDEIRREAEQLHGRPLRGPWAF